MSPMGGVQSGMPLSGAFLNAGAQDFHAQPVEQVLRFLSSRRDGLIDHEVSERQHQLAATVCTGAAAAPWMMLGGFKNAISAILGVSALLAFATLHATTGIGILIALCLHVATHQYILWRTQQHQTEHLGSDAVEDSHCDVRRNGVKTLVSSRDVLPGDILLLSAGQIVPGDARLIESDGLKVDEAVLTGESTLVPKDAEAYHAPDEEVIYRSNMVFAGTRVKTGSAIAVVTTVGQHTVMGQITHMASRTVKADSPFTQAAGVITRRMCLFAFLVTALVLAIEFKRGTEPLMLAQLGLVLAIAAMPGILPGMCNLLLSMGLDRLKKEKILIKNLQALESIRDITVLCSDKTGTLTENHLNVEKIFLPDMQTITYNPMWCQGDRLPNPIVEAFMRIARMNNSIELSGIRSTMVGDPIDVALYRAAPATVEVGCRKKRQIPFDSETLRMATVVEMPDGKLMSLIKGAPEMVLQECGFYMKPDGTVAPMSVMQKADWIVQNREMAYENNYRIIGFAEKPLIGENEDPYTEAVFIGWVCLVDPAKPGVKEAIAGLKREGVNVVMVTGDQKSTAEITAKDLGIIRDRDGSQSWLRAQLETCNGNIPDAVRVFARTKPEEKLYIVEALENSGHVVAMVGDGVNDAPALQKSDVAIAMGYKGSEAAKDSADIILLNDRLQGVLSIMTESRRIRRKIQACLQYMLSCNIGLELLVAVVALSLTLGGAQSTGLSVNVLQILWLTLLVTVFPTLALGLAPDDGFARDGANRDNHVLLSSEEVWLMVYWGVAMMLTSFAVLFVALKVFGLSVAESGTLAFSTMAFCQALHWINVQYLHSGRNAASVIAMAAQAPITWIVTLLIVALQCVAVYLPVMNSMLGTVPVPMAGLAGALVAAAGMTMLTCKTLGVSEETPQASKKLAEARSRVTS
ncbi:MAG: cation-translocating P-type ATPase [Candidatus Melainabacteria bacterium]